MAMADSLARRWRGLVLVTMVGLGLALQAQLTAGGPAFADEEPDAAATSTPSATAGPSDRPGGSAEPGERAVAPGQPGGVPDPTATPTRARGGRERAASGPRVRDTATPTPAALPFPIPADQPPDYPIPNGHFFSQALPGASGGVGFSLADAAGVPFWSEYQRLGGLTRLGYPISRRFVDAEGVAQALQAGLLRWQPELGQAALLPLDSLPELPLTATQPELPFRLGASAARPPWSGWWWPASALAPGPYLFSYNGPLAKYDRYVEAGGRPDPLTLEWERSELLLDDLDWAGHCNGWAAAALLEPEPTEPRQARGIHFGVADLKGLLSAYHFADAAAWLYSGADDNELSPLDLHRQLLSWLGGQRMGFVATFRPAQDQEVWSFPLYRFELTMGPDALDPDLTHVLAAVWLADNNVPPDFVGLRPWRGEPQLYEYQLRGPREAPTAADWAGRAAEQARFTRPSIIWYPDPDHRNLGRTLASPNLEYRVIEQILDRRPRR